MRLGIEYDGEETRIGFSPGFLFDAVEIVDGRSVRYGFSNPRSAARLTDDAGMLHLIMPLIVE